jgi:uncharacterized membrane protein
MSVSDAIGEAAGRVAREAVQSLSSTANKTPNGRLSGPGGLAAGAGLATLVPLAVKGVSKLINGRGGADGGSVGGVAAKVREAATGTVKDAVGKKVDDAGGVGGAAKQAAKDALPGSGGGGDSGATEGVPKGRQMPVQQCIDVAVPLQEAYNAWTQFEDWPQFMHRLDRVTQEDDSNVSFKTKIWGMSKEFQAEIVEQRPDDRIKWRVTEGVTHTGVVSFHELSDRLTRIDVDITVNPGSLIEKAARGMRHVKRAVRADLARFKAHVEIDDEETGAWRGVIEDGEVQSSRAGSSSGGRSGSSSRGRSRSSSNRRSGSSSASSRGRSSSGSSRGRSSSGSSRGRSSSGSSRGRSSSGSSRSSANRAKATSQGRSGSGSRRRQSASSRS